MRTGLAFAIGAAAGIVAGGVGTYLLTAPSSTRLLPGASTGARPAAPASTSRARQSRSAAADSSTSERAELYAAAARADAVELERLVAAAAAAGRELELAVLLARYAELDPVRAVELARAARLPAAAAAPLYAAWSARDADAALAALAGIPAPTDAGTIAAAILPMLHVDDAFERVAAALGVRSAAVQGVMLGLPVDSGTLALERLSQDLARRDLSGTRALLSRVRDAKLRTVLEAAVLQEWARTDPDGLLDYVATLDSAESQRAIAITTRDLSRADPLRMLDVARQLSGDSRQMLERSAVQRLAGTDARAALRYVERMPVGQKRQLLPAVGFFYGQQQPDEALAWARAQERGVLGTVIGGIAVADPDRALALAAAAPPAEQLGALQAIAGYRQVSGGAAAAIADRIAAFAEPAFRDAALETLLTGWGYQKPQEAFDWLQRNGARVSASVYHNIGRQLAMRDPAAAASYVPQIPSAARPGWIAAVAQGMAQNDVRQGLDWLDQFRGQAGHGEGVAALGPELAQEDPAAAAALLATVDGPMREDPRTVQMIADVWGRQDPAAAAQWVTTLETRAARSTAIQMLTGSWSGADFPAARQWVLRLPAGGERDAALGLLFMTRVEPESQPDPAVARAFSSNAALESAVMNAARQIAVRNPDRARSLAAAYLADPAARARAEKLIGEIQRGEPYEITFGVSQ